MKRLFILASAAIVAFASCAKTEVVYNEAPQEIGFKAVTGMMTKAVQTANNFTQTMGVLAYNTSDKSEYFANTSFGKNNGLWTASKYWPIETALDFVVYSPYLSSGVNVAEDRASFTVVVPSNSPTDDVNEDEKLDVDDQTDYMYGKEYYTNFDKNTTAVPVDFGHAMAMVTVKFKGDDDITVSDAMLNGTVQNGTYEVSYSEDDTSIEWIAKGNAVNLPLVAAQLNENTPTTVSYLVVPNTAGTISFKYKNSGMTGNALSKNIDLLEEWLPGTHYTYTVSIAAHEIKFTVDSVDEWPNGEVSTDTTIE